MKNLIVSFLFILVSLNSLNAQIRITVLNSEADEVLHGNYNPQNYESSQIIHASEDILNGIVNEVSTDSIRNYLEVLDGFHNRNTGSDTLSEISGIGAARRWIHRKFESYSATNENRLLVSFMRFKISVCGMLHHKNVLAVLPGADTTKKDIVIIQGHYDTRCEGVCDIECYSPGVDDNGSGTALVMELARVMSKYTFDRTIVFAALTGEDQGLYGAKAFSIYIENEEIPIKAVLNNDVVGGITCGNTSSPPSCPYYGHIDSTHVRVFSFSQNNDSSAISPHKQLARYTKMMQEEKINPLFSTPMDISLMIMKDRIGRSGDHLPFTDLGIPAIRFCSANEHGDGSGTPPDRQHTTIDLLGVDTTSPPDGVIDSFYVDLNYLKRNTIINGVNGGFLANSPHVPQPNYTDLNTGVKIEISGNDTIYNDFKVGVRRQGSGHLYFDSIYSFTNTRNLVISGLDPYEKYFFSVMNMKDGYISAFPDEYAVETSVGIYESPIFSGVSMSQNYPNPSKGKTEVIVSMNTNHNDVSLLIRDITGRTIENHNLNLNQGENKIILNESKNLTGIYLYSLIIDGIIVQTNKMILY
jgi:Peptidase family M28/Secretion system C-terminal sorting domain